MMEGRPQIQKVNNRSASTSMIGRCIDLLGESLWLSLSFFLVPLILSLCVSHSTSLHIYYHTLVKLNILRMWQMQHRESEG